MENTAPALTNGRGGGGGKGDMWNKNNRGLKIGIYEGRMGKIGVRGEMRKYGGGGEEVLGWGEI